MTLAELERRLLALERRVPGGTGSGYAVPPGLSTLFGVATQNYRDRFPARLTSTFSSTTGYSWERLVLDRTASPPELATVTDPQTGAYAFTPDNNESLSVGDRGWLEADPNAAGWIFIPESGSSGIGTADSASLSSGSFNITSTSDQDTGLAIELPSDGDYLLFFTATGRIITTSVAGGDGYIQCRLYRNAVALSTYIYPVSTAGANIAGINGTASGIHILTGASAGDSIELYASRSTGPTYSSTILWSSSTGEMTKIAYLQIG